jgi:hypothetical protein
MDHWWFMVGGDDQHILEVFNLWWFVFHLFRVPSRVQIPSINVFVGLYEYKIFILLHLGKGYFGPLPHSPCWNPQDSMQRGNQNTSLNWVFIPLTPNLPSTIICPTLLQLFSLCDPPPSLHFIIITNMHCLECGHSWQHDLELLGPLLK